MKAINKLDTHSLVITICLLFSVSSFASKLQRIDTYENKACALYQNYVTCWGDNGWGTTETAAFAQSGPYSDVAVGEWGAVAVHLKTGNVHTVFGNYLELPDFVKVDVSKHGFCGIRKDDSNLRCVKTFRDYTSSNMGDIKPPSDMGPVKDFVMSEYHGCAITIDDEIRCWGESRYGSVENPKLSNVKKIITGSWHDSTCAVWGSDEQVTCWGSLDGAQAPKGVSGFSSIAVIGRTFCGILSGQGPKCWDRFGRPQTNSIPRSLLEPGKVIEISSGGEGVAIFRTSDDRAVPVGFVEGPDHRVTDPSVGLFLVPGLLR